MQERENGQNNRVSARLVEEAYVTLQEQMRTYRQAKNRDNRAAGLDADTEPVIMLQDAVETFYHLIRTYVKDEPRLAEYWRGALAKHPERQHSSAETALEYYEEHSVGVWQSQVHTGAVPAAQPQTQAAGTNGAVADGGTPDTLADWHAALGLPATSRILWIESGAQYEDGFDGWYYKEGRFAVVGLREITNWEVTTRKQHSSGAGFMAGESSSQEVRDPEPAAKVETAARMLVEVADELGAIAGYEPAGDRVHGTPRPNDDT
jgi:hypothetical protein